MAAMLQPADETFFETAPCRYVYSMPLTASAEQVWAGLVDDRPLAWVHGLRVNWTSPRPFGTGTTRTASGGYGLLRLNEHYFRWEEGRRQSFYATTASLPLFRRFAEDYVVEPDGDGCTFTWTFAIEPKGPPASVAAIGAAQRPAFAAMARDTRRHFGSR